jgi:peptide deformylase
MTDNPQDFVEASEEQILDALMNTFVRDIVVYPSDLLHQQCRPVSEEEFGKENLAVAIKALQATMIFAESVGLSANQVSIDRQVFVMTDETFTNPMNARVFINPEIIEESKETITINEGCPSLPSITAHVVRPRDITLKYQDFEGKTHTEQYSGLEAVIIQHQVDLLNGIIFPERLSKFGQERLKESLKKNKKLNEKTSKLAAMLKQNS